MCPVLVERLLGTEHGVRGTECPHVPRPSVTDSTKEPRAAWHAVRILSRDLRGTLGKSPRVKLSVSDAYVKAKLIILFQSIFFLFSKIAVGSVLNLSLPLYFKETIFSSWKLSEEGRFLT